MIHHYHQSAMQVKFFCFIYFSLQIPAFLNNGVAFYRNSYIAKLLSLKSISQYTLSNTEVDKLVNERVNHRLERNYTAADNIKDLLEQYDIEITDFPYVTWKYLQPFEPLITNGNIGIPEVKLPQNLMWIASNAYDLIHSNKSTEAIIIQNAIYLLKEANSYSTTNNKKRARIKEMQGRKYADAAYEFSLSGITSKELYTLLLNGAKNEIKRYGKRASCRAIDILQVVERIAVAGVTDQEIYLFASELLQYKIDAKAVTNPLPYKTAIDKLASGQFSLFSDMPLLWLWRFAARQRKHGNQIFDNTSDNDMYNPVLDSFGDERDNDNADSIENDSISCLDDDTYSSISNNNSSNDSNNSIYTIDSIYMDNGNNGSRNNSRYYKDISNSNKNNHSNSNSSSSSNKDLRNSDIKKKNVATETKYPKPLTLPIFADLSLSLVIDIGCGYGVSCLGMSYYENKINDSENERNDRDIYCNTTNSKQESKMVKINEIETSTNSVIKNIYNVRDVKDVNNMSKYPTQKHNFLACDMSHRGISYANGIAKRWEIDGSCQFIEADAVSFLEMIKHEYKGEIECILINFPTPYTFGADSNVDNYNSNIGNSTGNDDNTTNTDIDNVDSYTGYNDTSNGDKDSNNINNDNINSSNNGNAYKGNKQLPIDLNDFMVTPLVIELCREILNKNTQQNINIDSKNIKKRNEKNDINNTNNIDNINHINNAISNKITLQNKKYLLIQTNVEDVAITLKNMITKSVYYNTSWGFFLPSELDVKSIREAWNGDLKKNSQEEIANSEKLDNNGKTGSNSSIGGKDGYISISDSQERINANKENENDDYDNNKNNSNKNNNEDNKAIQKRTTQWIAQGGERAVGREWLSNSLLPVYGRTETEVMCGHEKKPVHRILFLLNS